MKKLRYFLMSIGILMVHFLSAQVISGEYFIDTDPGTGNGTAMTAEDGNLGGLVENLIANHAATEALGLHSIGVRVQAPDGWSNTFKIVFEVTEDPQIEINKIQLTAGEYYFDTDPGSGNGTPMLAEDGSFGGVLENLMKDASINLPAGMHLLGVRAQSGDGGWSNTFKIVFEVEAVLHIEALNGAEEICQSSLDGYQYVMHYPDPNPVKTWLIEGGTITNQYNDTITVSWNATGPYRLRLQECFFGECDTVEQVLTVIGGDASFNYAKSSFCKNESNPVATISGDQGGSFSGSNGLVINSSTGEIDLVNSNAGDYTVTYSIAGACAVQSEVQISIKDTFEVAQSETVCFGESYDFHGTALTSTGIYRDTLSSTGGCDSIVELNLTVLPQILTTSQDEVCEGESYEWRGKSFSASGNYYDTLTAVNGCDSVLELALLVNPLYLDTTIAAICNGSSYSFADTNYATAGTHSRNFLRSTGCDSILTLVLTVNDVIEVFDTVSICNGGFHHFAGQDRTTAGDYSVTNQSVSGCDSTSNLHLIVNPTYTEDIYDTICEGETYLLNGVSYTLDGTYQQNPQTVHGCDSLLNLYLTVLSITRDTTEVEICNGTTYDWNGTTYDRTGFYTDTLTNAAGCDSIVNLDLLVPSRPYTQIFPTICHGDTFFIGTRQMTSTGTSFNLLTSEKGCDSMVYVSLTVLDPIETNLNESICSGSSYSFGGQQLTQAGQYADTLQSASGCDSIINLTLSVGNSIVSHEYIDICEGETIWWFNHVIDQSGTYIQNFILPSGCDSTVHRHVTFHQTYNTGDIQMLCDGETLQFGSQTITASGSYQETFQSIYGCDSIVNLTVILNPKSEVTLNEQICEGESFAFGGKNYFFTGIYRDTLTNVFGCDSITTLNLTVYAKPDVTIYTPAFNEPGVLAVGSINGSYQWIDCADNSELVGETNKYIEGPYNGKFVAAIVTENGCVDTSDCEYYGTTGVEEANYSDWKVFPNPMTEDVTIKSNGEKIEWVKMTDLNGKLVLFEQGQSDMLKLDISELVPGTYFISIKTNLGIGNKRVVKR